MTAFRRKTSGLTIKSKSIFACFILAIVLVSSLASYANASCLADDDFNDFFEQIGDRTSSIPRFNSCCMYDVCGLQCPTSHPEPGKGYGYSIIVAIVLSFVIGVGSYFLVQDSVENFFVAGRSLPLFMVTITLAAQSIDSNALLGNVDLSYRFSFWDGAVLPLGLGLSLIINAFFFAEKIHEEEIMTLPDIFAKRYGKTVELLVSIATVISFMMLLSGNLVGMGVVLAYVLQIEESGAIWISASVIWAYTVCGGLFSVAYTDLLQSGVGWLGCLALAYWVIFHESIDAPPPSIGFPGYIYPDGVGEGAICDMYEGVPCNENDTSLCCYNEALWCPLGLPNCDRYDRAAYPTGDSQIFKNQMTDRVALSPFPNAILWNWATIFILAFGNLAALDFQARCMASRTGKIAKWACLLGGGISIFVGIPFSFLGSIVRPRAAFLSIVVGAGTRLCLEFILSKDGSLLLPFSDEEFLNYGSAASTLPPPFVNASEVWDPDSEQCEQEPFKDYTGIDSLAAPIASALVFIAVQIFEHMLQKPLFVFPGGVGYDKTHGKNGQKVRKSTKGVEVFFAGFGVIFLVVTIVIVFFMNTL